MAISQEIENRVRRTDSRLDHMVRHLGYQSVQDRSVTKTDKELIAESQERLRGIEKIPDSKLTAQQWISLKLARELVDNIQTVRKAGVHAAMIPPASDRVRTAGMYGKQTEEIFISADQLEKGKSTVDTVIHEMAHHTSGAEDGEKEHNDELSRLGGLVVTLTARGNFDEVVKDPNFHW